MPLRHQAVDRGSDGGAVGGVVLDELDRVGEADHGDAVVGGERLHQALRRSFRLRDRLAGHAAADVHQQQNIERSVLAGGDLGGEDRRRLARDGDGEVRGGERLNVAGGVVEVDDGARCGIVAAVMPDDLGAQRRGLLCVRDRSVAPSITPSGDRPQNLTLHDAPVAGRRVGG